MIGIIGAMDSEIARYLEEMTSVKTEDLFGISFHQGELWDVPVVVCKCGVGKVNAAMCTQILGQHYQVKQLIFTGVAGALHPDLDIGDIVISSECQYHDMDVTALGFPKGMIPFQETSIFPANPNLIQLAQGAGQRIEGVQVLVGKVLSGDQFISNKETVTNLHEEMNGICVEMEGAAVAHVAHMMQIPYVVIRSISDRADHSANVNFLEFEKMAAERSCQMVQDMFQQITNV
jgi:adenosylhomocysteine nucleosidase